MFLQFTLNQEIQAYKRGDDAREGLDGTSYMGSRVHEVFGKGVFD